MRADCIVKLDDKVLLYKKAVVDYIYTRRAVAQGRMGEWHQKASSLLDTYTAAGGGVVLLRMGFL